MTHLGPITLAVRVKSRGVKDYIVIGVWSQARSFNAKKHCLNGVDAECVSSGNKQETNISPSNVKIMTIMIFTMLMLMMVMMLNKHLLTRRRVTRARPMSPSPYRVAATVQRSRPLYLSLSIQGKTAQKYILMQGFPSF